MSEDDGAATLERGRREWEARSKLERDAVVARGIFLAEVIEIEHWLDLILLDYYWTRRPQEFIEDMLVSQRLGSKAKLIRKIVNRLNLGDEVRDKLGELDRLVKWRNQLAHNPMRPAFESWHQGAPDAWDTGHRALDSDSKITKAELDDWTSRARAFQDDLTRLKNVVMDTSKAELFNDEPDA